MRIKGLLLDIDGVLVDAGRAVPGGPEALRALASEGIPYRLVSNSSQRSRRALAMRLQSMGYSVDTEEIFTPAVAAARFLVSKRASAYLAVREEAKEDFQEVGVREDDRRPRYVVLGDMGEDVTYGRLNRILRFLLGGSQLIALGRTRIWRAPDGPALDVGAFVALFEEATGKQAIVFGKPEPRMFEEAAHSMRLKLEDVAMVGDDADVDVAAAKRAGAGLGVLVRTGKYRPGDESRYSPPPDEVRDSFPEFVNHFLSAVRSAAGGP